MIICHKVVLLEGGEVARVSPLPGGGGRISVILGKRQEEQGILLSFVSEDDVFPISLVLECELCKFGHASE